MGRTGKQIPAESLLTLRARLASLGPRDPQRPKEVEKIAKLFGISTSTVYRALKSLHSPKGLSRADRGHPRALGETEMARYCEIIAALKIRTSNGKGHRLSTIRTIEILEEFGVETPEGLVQAEKGVLMRSTVDRWLKTWGYDHQRMVRPPTAVRFEAQYANEMWQFDMSPSDLKHIAQPTWVKPGRGRPTLMLFSVVDDRSGVAYQEYRCVYGEDAESGLQFLFNAMAAKDETSLQGIPQNIYLDNGPITKSLVFQNMMEHLGINWQTHLPAGSDGFRSTARSKGKVERPFRTVKEAHETLYYFHKPETETEANTWLKNYINRYNERPHRREKHSRIEDWLSNLPDSGVREMCSWERYCAFAREPESRKVGADARITVRGTYYEVDSNLAGEEVIVWWGLFDHELFVEWNTNRFGPYRPVGGHIPLHRYRRQKKSIREKRSEKIVSLSEKISVPRAVFGVSADLYTDKVISLSSVAFDDPDPWGEAAYINSLGARRAISEQIGKPLASHWQS